MANDEFIKVLKYFDIYRPENKYKIVCPFHGDKNASLQINVDEGYFFCYGCECKGGAVELYKQFYKLKNKKDCTDIKAIIQIKKICKGLKNSEQIEYKKPEENRNSINESRDFYYNLPIPNWFKPSKNEIIYEETIQCRKYMNGRGFNNRILFLSGAKPTMNKNYPIVFPLLENGIFRGYVMRTFDPEVEQNRKYLYNRGFRRQKSLPGNYKGYDYIVCVEGYLDCLKAQQIGVKNTVSFLGWKASQNQLTKIKNKGIKLVICALDNDPSGEKGYRYLKAVCKNYGFKVVRLKYPEGIKDFGDIRSHSVEADNVLRQIKKFKKYIYK